MKKLTLFVCLLALPIVAQEPAKDSILEIKAQLAESQKTVAELKQEIVELQIRVRLAERAALPEVEQARQQTQAALQGAKDAAIIARSQADSEKQQAKTKGPN